MLIMNWTNSNYIDSNYSSPASNLSLYIIYTTPIGLLHNHWFLIEEGGLGWDRKDGSYIVFSMRQKAAQLLTYKSPASVRLKSRKVILLLWKSEIDSHNVCWFKARFLVLSHWEIIIIAILSHPHTPVLTVSAVVLWLHHTYQL